MEDVVERCARMHGRHCLLSARENLRPQLGLGRRQAMRIAECRGDQVSAALACAEYLGDAEKLRRVCVEARGVFAFDVVLRASDDAAFELEDHAGGGAQREQLIAQAKVLLEWQRRTVEHLRREE